MQRIFSLKILIITAGLICFIGLMMITNIAANVELLMGAAEKEGEPDEYNDYPTGLLPLSKEVLALKDNVLKELKKYGKEQYIYLYLAVIEQESHGKCEDVFQCSESLGKPPNSISKEESIKQGVKYLSGMLDKAKVTSPTDIEHIKIALQAYNFGGGFIDFAAKYLQKDNFQAVVDKYAKEKSNGVKNKPPRDEQLGTWKYGDQHYTDHVLRYYYNDETGADKDVEIKGIELSKRMQWLFPAGVPTTASVMEQYLTSVTVPTCDTQGKIKYVSVRCHRKLAGMIKVCFEEMAKMKFPVQYSGCYVWRTMRGSNSQSHHSYGVAIDINASANAQHTHGNKSSPYYITKKVVNIWKSHGFYWGGDWDEASLDPMHFTYTNH